MKRLRNKSNQQYVYAEVSDDGWGCCGIFPGEVVDKTKLSDSGKPIVDSKHLIIGIGPGWDRNAIIDEIWASRACEVLNVAGTLVSSREHLTKTGLEAMLDELAQAVDNLRDVRSGGEEDDG